MRNRPISSATGTLRRMTVATAVSALLCDGLSRANPSTSSRISAVVFATPADLIVRPRCVRLGIVMHVLTNSLPILAALFGVLT